MRIPCDSLLLSLVCRREYGPSLSDDLRHRVLAASAGGMSALLAAARFGIWISTAIVWIASAAAHAASTSIARASLKPILLMRP